MRVLKSVGVCVCVCPFYFPQNKRAAIDQGHFLALCGQTEWLWRIDLHKKCPLWPNPLRELHCMCVVIRVDVCLFCFLFFFEKTGSLQKF